MHLSGRYWKVESLYDGQIIHTLTLSWAWLTADVERTCFTFTQLESTATIILICVTSKCEFRNIQGALHILLDASCACVRVSIKPDMVVLQCSEQSFLFVTRDLVGERVWTQHQQQTHVLQNGTAHLNWKNIWEHLKADSLEVMTWSLFILAQIDLNCWTFYSSKLYDTNGQINHPGSMINDARSRQTIYRNPLNIRSKLLLFLRPLLPHSLFVNHAACSSFPIWHTPAQEKPSLQRPLTRLIICEKPEFRLMSVAA